MPELNALLFRRRPSALEGGSVYLLHALGVTRGTEGAVAYESDRAHFLGRGRTPRSPAAFRRVNPWLPGACGATLDPAMALGVEVDLGTYETVRLVYLTIAGASRHEVLELAGRYRTMSTIDRAFEGARTRAGLQLRQLGLESSGLQMAERLLSSLVYPHTALRASAATLSANTKGQAGLWGFGISGDDPILLIRISGQEETGVVRELLRAHEFWRWKGVRVDLVILNLQDSGYEQELQSHLHRLVAEAGADAWLNQRGGIFVLRADTMTKVDRILLETAARVVLDGSRGPLSDQLAAPGPSAVRPPVFVPAIPRIGEPEPTPPLHRPDGLLFDNGIGGFSSDGREYIIYLGPGRTTPRPWVNVIAYPRFGFMVSEAGSGYTWAENSAENRLTPWSNDPVRDTPGEVLYLRDEETGEFWSPTPLPAPAPEPYLVRHGAGYTTFEHHSHGLMQRLRVFAVPEAPVKVIHLRLTNAWRRIRRITATFHLEWVLGTSAEETQPFIVTEHHARGQALLARNAYNSDFGEAVAFVAARLDLHGLTADRCEFLGRMGTRARPPALERIGLAGEVGAGRDPCAALQLHLELSPGESKEVYFLLGQGADREEALGLIDTYREASRVDAAWLAVANFWDGLLRAVTVHTPDPAMDLLLNQWLLYQTLSCRVWGRSALYQSAGAYGFRDQLQDIMALGHCAPEVAREHILRAARHQFEEGDVLHWWHPPSIRGVRTLCSDDLLWLPYVTAHYVTVTGDESILHERLPFLRGPALTSDENEHYDVYDAGPEAGTLYEHCCRALDKGSTAGAHGLPLIGAGDWNDGLSRVGLKGQGESIWLGWFLHAALTAFAPWCLRQGEETRASEYLQCAERIRQALEAHGWDGRWYRRAYDDDGRPLGSAERRECQIDSVAQSWAVLSAAAEPVRAAQGMQSLLDRLVRPGERLVLLLAPPFDTSAVDPGYIMGYPPGVRENGGQYTHAAVWAAWALAAMGRGDQAEELFRFLNPIYHGDNAQRITIYQVEPYVVAGDICGAPPNVGRGGWTWYTGSAAWMYRLGLEAILGVRREGRDLVLNPCIPSAWPGYDVTLRCGGSVYQIHVENPEKVNRGIKQVTFDGAPSPGEHIPLLDDGCRHEVHVLMGPRQTASVGPGSTGKGGRRCGGLSSVP